MGLLSLDSNLSLTPVELRKLLERAIGERRPAVDPSDEGQRSARRYRRRLTSGECRQAVSAYVAGRTVHQVAEYFGCHPTTMSAILKRHGVPLRLRSAEPHEIDEMVRLYRSGLSLARVGSELGFDASTVRNYLRHCGVRMRSTSGAER